MDTIEDSPPCPLALVLKVIGDRWSLLVVRDFMFNGQQRFGELLERNPEGIASNLLVDRLRRLLRLGLIRRPAHRWDRRAHLYALTEAGIQLATVIALLSHWGAMFPLRRQRVDRRLATLGERGPKEWNAFIRELRQVHSAALPLAGYRRMPLPVERPVLLSLGEAGDQSLSGAPSGNRWR